MSRHTLVLLAVALASQGASAFVSSLLRRSPLQKVNHGPLCKQDAVVVTSRVPVASLERTPASLWRKSTQLQAAPLPGFLKSLPMTPTMRTSILLTAAAVLYVKRKSLFYPGVAADASYTEPLPPGNIGGCPLWGVNLGQDTNKAFSRLSSKANHAHVWKCFAFTKPMATLSGSKAIKKVLSKEFASEKKKGGSVSQLAQFGNSAQLFGTESMSGITDEKHKYQYLRQLVGQSMTPQALEGAMPALQNAAQDAVYAMQQQQSPTVNMEVVTKNLTLDVAWRQIIGLDLQPNEIETFRMAVHDWMQGIKSIAALFLPFPNLFMRKPLRGMSYLKSLIERRIDSLEKNGPDGSTMSAMVFATDEETNQKLTRQQIIDNTLLLIIAGSETSANTLTNAMLLLGMHPHVWDKVVQEQRTLLAQHGTQLTKTNIDEDCPYLDSVVREVMRLLPISGGGIRVVDDTMLLDGQQIPKNWWVMYSISLTHELDPKTHQEDGSHMDLQKGFQPERWLREDTRPTTEFMPFGAGVRFCLGHALAMTEMKTFLAVLARSVERFELVDMEMDGKMKWKEGVILTPKKGVVIRPHFGSVIEV